MQKRFIYILLFFVLTGYSGFAQGFDWQYSARMPFKTPKVFIGLTGSADYSISTGYINFIQKYFSCCFFENGTGIGYSGGAHAEWWLTASTALFGDLKYMQSNNSFKKQSERYPIVDSSYLQTEFEFLSNASYLTGEIGAKYRILSTHLHIDIGTAFALLVSNKYTHFDRAISQRSFNDGSREKTIIETDMNTSKLSPIVFYPDIRLGYDFSVGLGKYAGLYIAAGLPVMNTAKSADWKELKLSLGLTFLTGIK